MDVNDDKTLLRKWVTERSHAAFDGLVERYGPLVWGVVSRKLFDRAAAQDAFQRVFAALAQKAPALAAAGDDRPLGPWLHRCAVLEALREMRREARRHSLMNRYALNAEDVPLSGISSPSPDGAGLMESLLPHLDKALLELGEKDRRILLGRFYDRKSYAQIAAETGTSPAAAQRRGHRALERLAGMLKGRSTAVREEALAAGLFLTLCRPVPAEAMNAFHAQWTTIANIPAQPPRDWLSAWGGVKMAALLAFGIGLSASGARAWLERLAIKEFAGGLERPVASAMAGAAWPVAENPGAAASTGLDLAALRREIEGIPDLAHKDPALLKLRRIMYSLTPEEIPPVHEVLNAASNRAMQECTPVINDFFGRWAEIDPPAAMDANWELCLKTGIGSFWKGGENAFSEWMRRDSAAAWAWMRRHARTVLDWRWVATDGLRTLTEDPEKYPEAFGLIDSIPLDEAERELRVWLARRWLLSERQPEALRWLQQNYSPEICSTVMAQVAWLAGRDQDGLKEAAALLPLIEDSAAREQAAVMIFPPWIERNPTAGLAALAESAAALDTRPPGRAAVIGGTCLRQAGAALMKHGGEAVAEAVERIPEGPARREFIAGALKGLPENELENMKSILAPWFSEKGE